MSSKHHTNFATQLGAALARGWRAYVRTERRFRAYLIASGANDALATSAVWIARAALAAVFVYYGLPVLSAGLYYVASALIVIGIVVAAVHSLGTGGVDLSRPRKAPEWRNGHSGTGLYSDDDVRIDDHDPNNPRDIGS